MHVFVYGSLMLPEVLKAVIGRVPSMRPAILKGYRRTCIQGRVYPAIRPCSSGVEGEVHGLVLTVDEARKEDVLLDMFEDNEYVRTLVKVQYTESIGDDDEESKNGVDAWAYVWGEDSDKLIGDWCHENFRQKCLENYLVNCEKFAVSARKELFGEEREGSST